MSECGQRAVLFITEKVEGTTTNVARERIELRCGKAEGHEGEHFDPERGESWLGTGDRVTTLFRDESDHPT
ncbi:MAG: hypothetical protein JW751_02770 [Polyangiaceae bacterium]|nr:hypothetical protein [Polyangiaceae bacterium]